jgi:methylated-DNA-[protein]-cysteine S-methyltransferase
VQIATTSIETPLGRYRLAACDAGLCGIAPADDGALREPSSGGSRRARAHLAAGAEALREYFALERREFGDLALAPRGNAFALRVYGALSEIPFGRSESYAALARRIGHPGAARAVGLANARNPLALVVPCHRVIGADGRLTGYAGGLWRKRWLLEHEGALPSALRFAPSARAEGHGAATARG